MSTVTSTTNLAIHDSMAGECHPGSEESKVLYRDLRRAPEAAVVGKGKYHITRSGHKVFDGSGGSAVACLGHGDERIQATVLRQMDTLSYAHTHFFSSPIGEQLAEKLVASTDGKMARAMFVSSGSEAMEAAIKLARQYFLELKTPQPQRDRFISRQPSYHGATLGTLAVGGYKLKRMAFEPLLSDKMDKVSACHSYRGIKHDESEGQYVDRLAQELDDAFERAGPGNVCAFVAETVAGASLGCSPPVQGYFKAVKAICEKHGALLILDEVMCGMGRTGTTHAWQQEGVDQTFKPLLGTGYIPVAGILVNHNVAQTLQEGSGAFSHGQSFLAHPVACAAALESQKIIDDEDLLLNIRRQGNVLGSLLRSHLGDHPHVGDIRGRGLFWAVEFVKDRETKEPFVFERRVALKIHEKALDAPYHVSVYPGSGCFDGRSGDHMILAPSYRVTAAELEEVVRRVSDCIVDFFHEAKL